MTPYGHTFKHTALADRRDLPAHIADLFSVADCIAHPFSDQIPLPAVNGYEFFDDPNVAAGIARDAHIPLTGLTHFYYEGFEFAFDDGAWIPAVPHDGFVTSVQIPAARKLEGFDIVVYDPFRGCSPLSCNGRSASIPTNTHCLMRSFNEAKAAVETGLIQPCEPGPYRILAVYSVSDG